MPKIKFSEELKLQAVLEYLKGCESQKTVAIKILKCYFPYAKVNL